ncbi:MAG: heme exporter protein CcmD [Xanthomonadales bacterium]|nr:heme exporter protein CcmD [Xanthomonadales bacterium]
MPSYSVFVISAYLVGTVVLLWVALAPVFNKRTLLRQLKTRQARMERSK